jgi:hypothetical protein
MGKKRKSSEISKTSWIEDHVAAADLAYKDVSTSDIVDKVQLDAGWKPLKTIDTAQGLRCKVWMSPENGNVLVAFRGTQSIKEAKIDVTMGKTAFQGGKGVDIGHVHRGFGDSWKEMERRLTAELDGLKEVYCLKDGTTLQFTGHSLGGALADLATTFYADKYPKVQIVSTTLGAPTVGDSKYAEYSRSLTNVSRTRIVGPGDPVAGTKIPGLEHTENEHVIRLTKTPEKKKTKLSKLWGAIKAGVSWAAPGLAMTMQGVNAAEEGVASHSLDNYEQQLTENFTDTDLINTIDNPEVQQQMEEDAWQEKQQSTDPVSVEECKCECHQHDMARANNIIPPPTLGVSQMPDAPVADLAAPLPTIQDTVASNMNGDTIQQTKMQQELENVNSDQQDVVDTTSQEIADKVNEALDRQKQDDQQKLDQLQSDIKELTGYGVEQDENPFTYAVNKEKQQEDMIGLINSQIQREIDNPETIDKSDKEAYDLATNLRHQLNDAYAMFLSVKTDTSAPTYTQDQINQLQLKEYQHLAKQGQAKESSLGTDGLAFDTSEIGADGRLRTLESWGNWSMFDQNVGSDFVKNDDALNQKWYDITHVETDDYKEKVRRQKEVQDMLDRDRTGTYVLTEEDKTSFNDELTQIASDLKTMKRYNDSGYVGFSEFAAHYEYEKQRDVVAKWVAISGGDPMATYNQYRNQLLNQYRQQRMQTLSADYDSKKKLSAGYKDESGTYHPGLLQKKADEISQKMTTEADRRQTFLKGLTSNPKFQELYKNAKVNIQGIVNAFNSGLQDSNASQPGVIENQIMKNLGLVSPEAAQEQAWQHYTQGLTELGTKNLSSADYVIAKHRLEGEYSLRKDYSWLDDTQVKNLVDLYVSDPDQAEKELTKYQQSYWEKANQLYGNEYYVPPDAKKGAATLDVSDINIVDRGGKMSDISAEKQQELFQEWQRNPQSFRDYMQHAYEESQKQLKMQHTSDFTSIFGALASGAMLGGGFGGIWGAAAGSIINPKLWSAIDQAVKGNKPTGFYDKKGNFYGLGSDANFKEYVRLHPELGLSYHEQTAPTNMENVLKVGGMLEDQITEYTLMSKGYPPMSGTELTSGLDQVISWGDGSITGGQDLNGDGLPDAATENLDLSTGAFGDMEQNMMYYMMNRNMRRRGGGGGEGEEEGPHPPQQQHQPPQQQQHHQQQQTGNEYDLRIMGETNLVSSGNKIWDRGMEYARQTRQRMQQQGQDLKSRLTQHLQSTHQNLTKGWDKIGASRKDPFEDIPFTDIAGISTSRGDPGVQDNSTRKCVIM